MAISGNQLRGGGALDQAKKAFGAPGGPASLCSKAVTGRYPFTPGSTNDIPLDDFARLFAAGGLLDKFFNDNLQTFVDTSGATWKAQPVAGVAPPVTPADLAQFQRASQIRDLFFARRRQSADRAVRHHADGHRRQAGHARPGRPEPSSMRMGRSAPHR